MYTYNMILLNDKKSVQKENIHCKSNYGIGWKGKVGILMKNYNTYNNNNNYSKE